jgi:hypothetical protein
MYELEQRMISSLLSCEYRSFEHDECTVQHAIIQGLGQGYVSKAMFSRLQSREITVCEGNTVQDVFFDSHPTRYC